MFNDLSERLNGIFRNLKGKGKLSESNIKDSLKEIRMALLEADVNFRIVKNFIKEIQERALGQEVMKSLEPGQQVVKIVHEQLIALMDNSDFKLDFHNNKLTKIMLVGLQGSGKPLPVQSLQTILEKRKMQYLHLSLVTCIAQLLFTNSRF